jgi:adenylosuccinate synthase
MINGVTKIIMTKADVLDAFEELRVCVAYEADGKNTKEVPYQMTGINLKPQYENFRGWKIDSSVIKNKKDLPAAMQQYVEFINQYLGVRVNYISNGPGREQIVSLS